MTPQSICTSGSIITFYSYKGGVGRSMALANVAVLLARRGLRVLAVDWDLEAPGLERYFSYFSQSTRPGGLLPFFARAFEALQGQSPPPVYQDCIWKVSMAEGDFDLLPSGRDNHAHYARLLESFDWPDFFDAGGGEFIENLRAEWRQNYDIVLIDSRTGMSDAGGICTIQMPDVLVTMFTANEQSMSGVRDIIEAAQRARQRLAYDRMPLTVLPVLCRFASASEVHESANWLDAIATKFQDVCDDWRPPWVAVRTMFERLKVPQIDFYGFGERLAVVEQGVSDPAGMGFAFDRLSDLLGSAFQDLEGALGTVARKPSDWDRTHRGRAGAAGANVDSLGNPINSSAMADGPYDIFISYRRGGVVDEWVRRFVEDLTQWLQPLLPVRPRIFFDSVSLTVEQDWSAAISEAIAHSKIMIAVLTPAYFTSPHCSTEWRAFEMRDDARSSRIVPILLQGPVESVPPSVKQWHILRPPEHTLLSLSKSAHDVHYAKFLNEVATTVEGLLRAVSAAERRAAPALDPIEIQSERANVPVAFKA